jgi:hypothetical protein
MGYDDEEDWETPQEDDGDAIRYEQASFVDVDTAKEIYRFNKYFETHHRGDLVFYKKVYEIERVLFDVEQEEILYFVSEKGESKNGTKEV